MKPIEQMSLSECLWVICNPMDVTPQYTSTEILKEIAERINELTRWIPVEERLPTREDGYAVLVINADNGCCVTRWDLVDKHVQPITHWKRIDKPEGTL